MPLDRGFIDQQLQEIGEGSRWWEVRELRDLPGLLRDDERILALARGKVGRLRWLRRKWLIVVTDQRLVCLRSGRGPGWRQLEVPGRQIERVRFRIGPFRGRVLADADGRTYRFLAPRSEAHRLARALAFFDTHPHQVRGSRTVRGVRRAMDHMLALPAVALGLDVRTPLPATAERSAELQKRADALEAQNQELQDQVDFLEQLVRERRESRSPAE